MTDCLMIFAKAPEEGKVKTRLRLPDRDAKALHEAFVKDVLRSTEGPWARILWSTDPSHSFFEQVGIPIRSQRGLGLGERLANAFSEMLRSYQRVVVIGTDAPHLKSAVISAAFRKLAQTDAVIGPSSDGGYYLLGLRRMIPALFTSDIGWGGEQVFTNTMKAMKSYLVEPSLLPVDFDVDRPEDLKRLADRDDLSRLSSPRPPNKGP